MEVKIGKDIFENVTIRKLEELAKQSGNNVNIMRAVEFIKNLIADNDNKNGNEKLDTYQKLYDFITEEIQGRERYQNYLFEIRNMSDFVDSILKLKSPCSPNNSIICSIRDLYIGLRNECSQKTITANNKVEFANLIKIRIENSSEYIVNLYLPKVNIQKCCVETCEQSLNKLCKHGSSEFPLTKKELTEIWYDLNNKMNQMEYTHNIPKGIFVPLNGVCSEIKKLISSDIFVNNKLIKICNMHDTCRYELRNRFANLKNDIMLMVDQITANQSIGQNSLTRNNVIKKFDDNFKECLKKLNEFAKNIMEEGENPPEFSKYKEDDDLR